MKIIRSQFLISAAALLIAASFSSCVKKDFDTPPSTNVNPNVTVNKSISGLKAMANVAGYIQITDDIIISGTINSDDHSGNIYKQIIFQDSTAGIMVNVDLSNYYALYSVGRQIFVKCKGLYIGYIKGMVQLGLIDSSGTQPTIGRIPQSLVDTYILRGVWNKIVTPKVVSLASLAGYKKAYENELITFNNVEFVSTDTSKLWANAPAQSSVARYIEDCSGNQMEIYTSGYATFASSYTPAKKGSITAIYQVYNSTVQLVIRDIDDVKLTSPWGFTAGGTIIGTGSLMNLADIRLLYTGCGTTFATGTKIRGTVISDKLTTNITGNNLVMQDGSGGMAIRFTSPNTFALNDSIEINITGDSLTNYQGLMQINNIDIAMATVLGTGSVTPRLATLAQITANQSEWESTLLKITGVTLSSTGGTFSGNVTMTDATGAMELYTRSAATFSGTTLPTGVHTVTGYLSQYNGTPELTIRSTSDVQ
jgi:DNA/RNA endonuclease YhcR with UshA esterase domain